jgi:beta-mannosidase
MGLGSIFRPRWSWQPAYVLQLGSSDIYVRNTLVDIYRQGQINVAPLDQSLPWVVNASLDVVGNLPSNATLSYTIADLSNTTISSGQLNNVTSGKDVITGSVMIRSSSTFLLR